MKRAEKANRFGKLEKKNCCKRDKRFLDGSKRKQGRYLPVFL